MECIICCDRIHGTNPVVSCGFCDFESCNRCTERYLLESNDDAHCMNCKKGWTSDILHKKMTKTFVTKKYKKHREDVLFDREKSLLPQTQPDVDAELRRRERQKVLQQLKNEELVLKRKLREIQENMDEVYHAGEIVADTSKRFHYTRKCPVETCKGFLDCNWICGICEVHICRKCNEPTADDHECDPNNVETMKLLKRDSKPCPSCGMIITKIDGCDQMWCTAENCHTAFSWRTGQKVYGNIHNPHYIQFTLERGQLEREAVDVPCGGIPEQFPMINAFDRAYGYNRPRDVTDIRQELVWFRRMLVHIQSVEFIRYNPGNQMRQINTDLRVKFMLSELPEDEFKIKLQQREKKYKKQKEFMDVLTMFVHTGSDILRHVMTLIPRRDIVGMKEQLDICNKLRIYANTQFDRIGKTYNCVPLHITEGYDKIERRKAR